MPRDDFTKPVIEALARRVGFKCSNPRCRAATVGPAPTDDRFTNNGVAAHITAASVGGPRYDSTMSREVRRSIANGIWLCQNCAHMVDSDRLGYPEDLVRQWKRNAEVVAAREIAGALAAGSAVVKLSAILSGHTNYVWDVIVTPDGREAVSASNDCTVRVWDLKSKLPRASLTGHVTWVCSVAVNRDGTLIAAGAMDGTVRCWNLRTTNHVCELPAGAPDAKVAWLPDGRLVVGDRAGCVRVWSLSEGGWVLDSTQNPHQDAILKIIPTGYQDEVATAATDGTAIAWCVTTGDIRAVLDGHSGDVNSVAICRAEDIAVTGGTDGTVVVWSLESGSRIATLLGHQGVVWRVAVSEHARMIASGSGDNTVRLWDLRSGDLLDELSHPDCVAAVSFDPAGGRLVVGCDDAHVYVYDVAPR
jgi:WD40 repeat protein